MVGSVFIAYFFLLFLQTICLDDSNISARAVQRPVRIGAFNIQNLGNYKLSNNKIMTMIIKIILRYDIILIQEIVTQDQDLMTDMLASVNNLAPSGVTYRMALSERLGRKTAKEQYAFLYREEMVSVLAEEVYPDKFDAFMRPPFIVHFSSPTIRDLPSFLAIGIHTQPSNAANETDSLVDVYNYASKKYESEDAIIMGDMNAGCATIRQKDWENIRLWTDKSFEWLIGHHVDTTTSANSCPYDRIVINGDKMKEDIIRSSATVFNFQVHFQLTIEQTRNISDHWPVEVRLRGKLSDEARENVKALSCFLITDNRKVVNPMVIHRARKKFGFQTTATKDENGNYVEMIGTKTSEDLDELVFSFENFGKRFPKVISPESLQSVQYKLSNGALKDDSSFTELESFLYSIHIRCDVEELECSILTCRETSIN